MMRGNMYYQVIIGIVCCAALCIADDKTTDDTYLMSIEQALRTHYAHCTGNSIDTKISVIARWKNSIDEQTKSDEYKALLKSFLSATGAHEPVYPCDVFTWRDDRQKKKEDAAFEKKRVYDESLFVARELRANETSPYDFYNIPFGISRPTFLKLFTTRFSEQLKDTLNYLYSSALAVEGRPCYTAFYFGENGAYYKYEIQSNIWPIDSLDTRVRPEVQRLGRIFEQKYGKAPEQFPIGLFDLHSGKLTPTLRWQDSIYTILVGIGMDEYDYYAKAVIIQNELFKRNKTFEKEQNLRKNDIRNLPLPVYSK